MTAASLAQTSPGICEADLVPKIQAIQQKPEFARSRWGIMVQTLNQGKILYSQEGDRYFIPASNLKLFTTAAALTKLGSQYRIRTSVYQTETGFRLVGRGDPSFKENQLTDLAQQLKNRGITQISNLTLDSSYFPGESFSQSWEWGDVFANYGAGANSLILNQNAVSIQISPQEIGQPLKVEWLDPVANQLWQVENLSQTVAESEAGNLRISRRFGKPIIQLRGKLPKNSLAFVNSFAVLEPNEYFLQHLRRRFILAGIPIQKAGISDQADSVSQEVAFVESPELSKLVFETNQNSNNLYSEALLRTLGAQIPTEDAAESGINQVSQILTQLGIDRDSYRMVDGSGLSRQNLATPQAFVQVLQKMGNNQNFRDSLPVAGISGTLKNRFLNSPLQGKIQAKTGTMTGVITLSGYLQQPHYQTLVFSILANHSKQSAAETRLAMDEMLQLFSEVKPCGNN